MFFGRRFFQKTEGVGFTKRPLQINFREIVKHLIILQIGRKKFKATDFGKTVKELKNSHVKGFDKISLNKIKNAFSYKTHLKRSG